MLENSTKIPGNIVFIAGLSQNSGARGPRALRLFPRRSIDRSLRTRRSSAPCRALKLRKAALPDYALSSIFSCMNRPIRFKFSPPKALAAIHWMVCEQQRLDLHTLLKACYFADKEHLNKYNRPIFGAVYRAMKFGPVPIEIYEMAKGEALWLAELGRDRYPWQLQGYHIVLHGNEEPDLGALSSTDIEALRAGFKKSLNMTFNERTAATHGPDWQAAELGFMKYEDMIEETSQKGEIVAYLKENSTRIRL